MRRSPRWFVLLLLLIAPSSPASAREPAPDPALVVPAAERQAESARLRALGLTVPPEGVVLERPFTPPYSQRSFIVPKAWFAKSGATVAPEQLALDLAPLQELMRRAYGGWDTAKARGWDWDKWFSSWGAALASKAGHRLPLAEAFAPVRALIEFQLDNHTAIPLGISFGSGSRTAVLARIPDKPCLQMRMSDGKLFTLDSKDAGQRVRKAQSFRGGRLVPVAYISYPQRRGDIAALLCGNGWVQAQPVWEPASADGNRLERLRPIRVLSGDAQDGHVLKLLTPQVAYLRLPTFFPANNIAISERKPSWPKPTGKETVLIVVLRDNSGGDINTDALDPWVARQRIASELRTPSQRGDSCLYPALRWNYSTISMFDLKTALPPDLRSELQGELNSLLKPAAASDCPRAVKNHKGQWDYRMHKMAPPGPVQGFRRILALVNDQCGSDCELMVEVLAELPETVVMGSNTFGVAQYIQPGYSVLPHTRLPFSIALGTSDSYGDNRSMDGYGLDVDILLSTEADWQPENLLRLADLLGGR